MTLKIKIDYCGGWGYKPKFDKVKSNLEKAFPNQLEITGEAIPGMSGCFEVILVESGKVLHSKKNGQGYVDNDAKLEAIIAGIKEALGSWLQFSNLVYQKWYQKTCNNLPMIKCS